MPSRPHFIILPDVLICVQAQAEAGREAKGMRVAGCNHIHHCIPRCCRRAKRRLELSVPRPVRYKHWRGRQKKPHTERGIKTSFATASTLSGFIAVGSSKTPHGLVCEPWPESDPHTHTQMHTHNERVTWRGKQEKQGDEADCVGELSVCEWDWSRGKHRCVVDSADKRRMKGCCVGESGLRSAARSAPTNSTFFSESVSPSTCPINNAAPAEIHNEAFLSERDEIILFSWTGSDGILLQIKPPEADEWPST